MGFDNRNYRALLRELEGKVENFKQGLGEQKESGIGARELRFFMEVFEELDAIKSGRDSVAIYPTKEELFDLAIQIELYGMTIKWGEIK